MKMLSRLLPLLVAPAFAAPVLAAPVVVTFDVAVANYVPTPGVIQNVKNEFSPLGFVFEDVANPAMGATLGKCGPGNGPVALFGFGNDFPGCGDTTPNMNILFVDPANPANPAYTTSFSIFNFDGLIQMSAYDIDDNLLGSVQNDNGLLSLSGIGQISRINFLSLDQDPTTMDTMTFEEVVPLQGVPEPGISALIGIALLGAGLARRRSRA